MACLVPAPPVGKTYLKFAGKIKRIRQRIVVLFYCVTLGTAIFRNFPSKNSKPLSGAVTTSECSDFPRLFTRQSLRASIQKHRPPRLDLCGAGPRKEHSFSRRSIEGHGGNHRCFKSNGRFYHSERKRSNGHWNRYSTPTNENRLYGIWIYSSLFDPYSRRKRDVLPFCRFRTSAGTAIGTLFRRISKERCIP